MSESSLLDRVRAALAGLSPREQKMFGGTCFMVNGNMVAGISKRGLLLRVGKAGHAAAVRHPHARPMKMGERIMQGYVFIDPAGIASDADLRSWLERSLTYVQTLPPKNAASPSKRSAAPRKRQ